MEAIKQYAVFTFGVAALVLFWPLLVLIAGGLAVTVGVLSCIAAFKRSQVDLSIGGVAISVPYQKGEGLVAVRVAYSADADEEDGLYIAGVVLIVIGLSPLWIPIAIGGLICSLLTEMGGR